MRHFYSNRKALATSQCSPSKGRWILRRGGAETLSYVLESDAAKYTGVSTWEKKCCSPGLTLEKDEI